MARKTTTLLVLLALGALAAASVSPTTASTSTTAVNRGRGARRAFVGRGSARPRGSPATSTTSSRFPTTASPSFSTASPSFSTASPSFSSASPSFSTTRRQVAVVTPTFAPPAHHPQQYSTLAPTFAPTPSSFPTTFPQQPTQGVVRIPGPPPRGDVFVASRRPPPSPLGFGPSPSPRPRSASQFLPQQQGGLVNRPRGTPVPIVALKFNLRDDGSYSTSSETGDGTVRQEQGQFNGAGMSVQGMYAYRDQDVGPVQVNYVADEYGFQPQGPNIHPAIMMAVAEQVQAARSSKSRQGAKGLNGLQDDGELDYDDDNGAGTTPSSARFNKAGRQSSRTVRRVVVRRLKK